MYRVVRAEWLSEVVKLLEVEAPRVARAAQPGQFLIVRLGERSERVPLTIADFDRDRGTVTIIFIKAGHSTEELAAVNTGDEIRDVVGPLGNHLEIAKVGTVVCVGGGVGVPALYPKAKALRAAGNKVISIIGARTAGLLVLENQMRALSDETYITTDDGSKGTKGFVTVELERLLREQAEKGHPHLIPPPSRGRKSGSPQDDETHSQGGKIDFVIGVGPVPMMKAIAEATRAYGVKTLVSLNPIMVDGTGMCGSCRVTVGGQVKFACVDGPIFDAHEVDFDELIARQRRFEPLERDLAAQGAHVCHLEQAR
jgi:ferredoxin--NADP+ reductase